MQRFSQTDLNQGFNGVNECLNRGSESRDRSRYADVFTEDVYNLRRDLRHIAEECLAAGGDPLAAQ